MNMDSLAESARRDTIESIFQTLSYAIFFYVKTQDDVVGMGKSDIGSPGITVADTERISPAALTPEWVTPLVKKINDFRRQVASALDELAKVSPAVKEYVATKKVQQDLQKKLVSLKGTLLNPPLQGAGNNDRTKRALVRDLLAVLNHDVGKAFEKLQNKDALKQAIEDAVRDVNERGKQIIVPPTNQLESEIASAIDQLESVTNDTPMSKKGSGVAAVRSRDSVKTIADYLEWHDHLQERTSEETSGRDVAVSARVVETLREIQKAPHVMYSLQEGGAVASLPRPFPQFVDMLRMIREVLKQKTKESSTFRESGVSDPEKAFFADVQSFVEEVNRGNISPTGANKDQPDRFKKTLVGIQTKIDKLSASYRNYLDSKGLPVKLHKSQESTGQSPGFNGYRSSPTAFNPPDEWRVRYPEFRNLGPDSRTFPDGPIVRDAPATMYRHMKPHVVIRFTMQLDRFLRSLLMADLQKRDGEDEKKRLMKLAADVGRDRIRMLVLERAEKGFREANEGIATIDATLKTMGQTTDPEEESKLLRRRKAFVEGKLEVLNAIPEAFETQLDLYMARHVNFLRVQHKDAFKYMMYWRGVHGLPPEQQKLVDDYFAELRFIREISHRTLTVMHRNLRIHILWGGKLSYQDRAAENDDYTSNDSTVDDAVMFENVHRWREHIEPDDIEEFVERITATNARTLKTSDQIADMYSGVGEGLRNIVLSGAFLVAYGLKATRVLFLYMALAFAEHVFQMHYARRVYGENKDPPHPMKLVWIALGVELGMTLVTVALLYLVRLLFGTSIRGFPLDDGFFMRFVADYIISTTVLLVLMYFVSQVIRNKKYFRYRYEGERGIRALSEITFYSAIVVLVVPFFRLI